MKTLIEWNKKFDSLSRIFIMENCYYINELFFFYFLFFNYFLLSSIFLFVKVLHADKHNFT